MLESFGVRQPIYLFEVNLEALVPSSTEARLYRPTPAGSIAQRDLAVVVSESVAAGEVARVIGEAGAPLLRSARGFDLYRGAQIPAGAKSLAYTLEFAAGAETPSESEVAACVERIVAALRERLQATTRSVA